MGLFNSKLVSEEGRAFAQVKIINVKQLPYIEAKVNQQEQIVKLVDQLLQLNKDLKTTTLLEKTEQLKQRIEYSEDRINKIVYELYGLTEEEVKITGIY